MPKSTPDEIRRRFDADVERFSNLQTGQSATVDAPLVLDLIACCAAANNPDAKAICDIGCGAGNYTLKLLERLQPQSITLIDLSQPMLTRAQERIGKITTASLHPHQSDIRDLDLGEEQFDIVVAAAVLHHLRDDHEWLDVFAKIHRSLKTGGSFWISDFINHAIPAVQHVMWQRYGEYLTDLKNEEYRDAVFAYIDREDSPRPLGFQLDLLKRVGFSHIEILHKNSCFAAFGGIR